MTRSRAALLLTAVLLAVLRFFQPSTELSWPATYQAVAHLFVGGLFVSAWHSKDSWQWGTFAAITLVEIAAALGGLL